MNNDEDFHFLPAENLLKVTNKKMENDVIKNTQLYAEKVITDIINRASLLTKHADKDVIDASEISIMVEKDFDYSFGLREIYKEANLPTSEHNDRSAEVNRQR
jgi:histone H3/H4